MINVFKENTIKNERIPIYLIGNKDDLEHKVDKKLIDELLQEYKGYEYRSVSALNDDNRISELFQEMAEKLFNNYKDVEKNQYIWKKWKLIKEKKINAFHVVKLIIIDNKLFLFKISKIIFIFRLKY